MTRSVQLEHRAALEICSSNSAPTVGGAVQIACSILDQAGVGQLPVGAVCRGTETVQHGLMTILVQFENRATVIGAARCGGTVQIPRGVSD